MPNIECHLELQHLTKTYRTKKTSKKALAGVSFTLGPGLYGLLGPNGAGKSTMMNIITGNLDATSGKVLWNGKNVLRMGREFRRILGYMPQQQNLYDSFTGRRFLLYIAALKEIPRSDAALQVQRVAELVHLSSELEKRLAAYSGGMKQRLLAAAALLGEPQILIMDEPTAGLDPKERVRLRQVLAQLAHDRIIIVATHVVSDVEHVASEILLLDNPTQGIDVGSKGEIYRLILQMSQEGKTIIVNTLEIPEIQKIADRCLVFYHGTMVAELERAEINEETVMLHATNAAGVERRNGEVKVETL